MDVGTFVDRYWFLMIGLAMGGTFAMFILGPAIAARAKNRITGRQYFSLSALVALLLGTIIGVLSMYRLDFETFSFLIFVLVFLGVLLGLALMIQSDAVRFSGWFSFGGIFQPVPERWAKPVRHSWLLTALFLDVGLIGGACVYILVLATA